MAILKTYTQQPSEYLDFDVYYRNSPDKAPNWLSTGDYLDASKTVVSVTPEGLEVINTTLRTQDCVKVWVSGGTPGVRYKVTIKVTTDLGRIKEDELVFRIRDY